MLRLVKLLFKRRRNLLLSLYIVFFLFGFTIALLDVPKVRLIERAVCEQYYRSHSLISHVPHKSIPENECKILPIQVEVATITGWRVSFDALPGILTSAFFGMIADRFGRRVALQVICMGEFLALCWIIIVGALEQWIPIRFIWGSSLFLMIGGGQKMFQSVVLTMITDITDHSERARLFFFFGLSDSISRILAPMLEAWTMSISLWLSFGIAIIMYFVISTLIWCIPETKAIKLHPNSNVVQPLIPAPLQEPQVHKDLEQTAVSKAPLYGSRPWKETVDLLTTRNPSIILFCFFMKRVGYTSEAFFPQYASERFHLVLRKTPWFNWAQALGSALMLGLALPVATAYMRKKDMSPRNTDLVIITCSISILSTGYFMLSQASVAVTFGAAKFYIGMGEGAAPGLQSLVSSFVDPRQNSRIFSAIAFVDTVGRLVGGPLMGKLLSIGRDKNQEPTGLIFIGSSCMFGVALLSLLLIN